MGWTDPRTWTTGEFPSASTMNTHVRDNLNCLGPGPQLAGLVDSSGSYTGVGFNAARNGVGDYTVNYTVAYSATPVVMVTLQGGSGNYSLAPVVTTTTTGFRVYLYNSAGDPQDISWMFIARLVSTTS